MSETIGDVIGALDEIIEQTVKAGSRLGYFPALYRRVTVAVAEAIEAGEFDDNPRMEVFDVTFARRYLDAFASHRAGEPTTESWRVCFEAANDPAPIVLQHLALGMNAHINLDLGIAAARVAPGDDLPSIRGDFERINDLLGSMVDEVQADLARIWPWLRPLDWLAGRSEERLAGFSIEVARAHAWRFATGLADRDEAGQERMIHDVDCWIAAFGRRVHRPGWGLSLLQGSIRLGERGSVSEIIEELR